MPSVHQTVRGGIWVRTDPCQEKTDRSGLSVTGIGYGPSGSARGRGRRMTQGVDQDERFKVLVALRGAVHAEGVPVQAVLGALSRHGNHGFVRIRSSLYLATTVFRSSVLACVRKGEKSSLLNSLPHLCSCEKSLAS